MLAGSLVRGYTHTYTHKQKWNIQKRTQLIRCRNDRLGVFRRGWVVGRSVGLNVDMQCTSVCDGLDARANGWGRKGERVSNHLLFVRGCRGETRMGQLAGRNPGLTSAHRVGAAHR